MAFVISKRSKSRDKVNKLYYVVSNYREQKKIKRNYLVSLGESPNLSLALQANQAKEHLLLQRKNDLENRLERVKRGDTTAFIRFCPYYRQQSRIIYFINMTQAELIDIRKEVVKLNLLTEQYPKC